MTEPRTPRRPRKSAVPVALRRPAGYTAPVVARGGFAQPSTNRRKPLKRRFDLTTSAPGVELRLPALPMVALGWRALSGSLTILLTVVLVYLWNAPTYRVDDIQIEGLQRLTSRDIYSFMNVRGEPIFAVDAVQVLQGLQTAFPELATMSLQVDLPAKLLLTLEERQPVLAWEQDGRTVWVDANGIAFPPRGDLQPDFLVIAETDPPAVSLQARAAHQLLDPEMVNTLISVYALAPEGQPLVYSAEYGLGWQDPKGWQAYFGHDLSDAAAKLQVYQSLRRYLIDEKIKPVFVSVAYPHAPYYRLEP